jgi:uracil-DNA glycosylase
MLKLSSSIIDDISLLDDKPPEFYKWVWKNLNNMNIPFLDLTYFIKLYNQEIGEEENDFNLKESLISEKNKELIEQNKELIEQNKELIKKNKELIEKNKELIEREPSFGQKIEELSWFNTSLIEYTKNETPIEWKDFFENILETIEFKNLSKLLRNETIKYGLYPEITEVYAAFTNCFPSNIKVIIIGQDPHHTPNTDMGIAFGHRDNKVKLQPLIRNIYKCLENDGFSANWDSGDLSHWRDQGVFLINTALTVRKNEAASHSSKSKNKPGCWDKFISQLFTHLEQACDHLIIITWGVKAQKYSSFFSCEKNFHIKSSNPISASYNSSNTEFIDHKPFSSSNIQLKKWNKQEINWNLK